MELTCKQAIRTVLDSPSDALVFAIYMHVRKKWRYICNQHDPNKRTLHSDIAVPLAQRLVLWGMNKISETQDAQLQQMAG